MAAAEPIEPDDIVPDSDDDELGVIGWVDADALREAEDWAGAMLTEHLRLTLWAAYELGLEFGPLMPGGKAYRPDVDTDVPARFALAQTMHARDLARASYTDQNGAVGPEGFAVTVWPMDRTVKNLYRPRRGRRRGPR